MKIEIHELATQEFDDAIEWYEHQARGLGKRFKNTVIKQIKKVQNNPSWFLKEDETLYKAYVPKFPYKILFTFDEDKIVIWAIASMSRKPWYWQSRMS
ncbi:MAG: type II toxin-antitoxin system RelE/ParE family toxin [Methylococcaceae bacterium]|nr:type II toxin-antitoxin system RelE/ParE family toxin [Methylococcaceae bacterium]